MSANKDSAFASLFAAFGNTDQENGALDISNDSSENVYSNFIKSLPVSNKASFTLNSDTLDNNYDDIDLSSNYISSDALPSYDRVQNESIEKLSSASAAMLGSPSSKFKNLNDLMNTLLLKDEESKIKDSIIMEIEDELNRLATDDPYPSSGIFDEIDEFNEVTEEMLLGIVPNIAKSKNVSAFNKLMYCGTSVPSMYPTINRSSTDNCTSKKVSLAVIKLYNYYYCY
jgi:hypothetical protein